ncbi:MAG TPA: type VI secretion system amidase effector protein Tae4 [Polyangia bacterium]
MATTFDALWANHPANETIPNIEPCQTKGRSNHANQCVIRLGMAFTRSGISLASYSGAFCWTSGHTRQHPLRVEQMKLWLDSDKVTFVPYAEKYVKSKRGLQKSSEFFAGRRGIVAFLDFWGTNNTGDHIDLWNGSAVAHGDPGYFARSRELWFWEMD